MRQSDSARPVSGEIMMPEALRERQPLPEAARAIVDAEYETVTIDMPRAAPMRAAGMAAPGEAAGSGLGILRPGAGAPRERGRRGGPAFWLCGIALVVASFWLAGGHSLVHGIPLQQSGGPAQALSLVDVQSRVERHGARALLFVDGAAFNEGDTAMTVPGLSIDVLGLDGSTTRYFLGTNDLRLEPGTRFPFSSRLVAPSEGVRSVSVTFRPS